MEQPHGFVAQGESGRVCRFRKALYGLKQSPQAWFGKFNDAVIQFGIRCCETDHYLDDIIVIGDNSKGIDKLKPSSRQSFTPETLGKYGTFGVDLWILR